MRRIDATRNLDPRSYPPRPAEIDHDARGRRKLWGFASNGLGVFASGVPFNGLFLYVLSLPGWLGTHLGLGPRQFFWFFGLGLGGILGGAFLGGRLARGMLPKRQIR